MGVHDSSKIKSLGDMMDVVDQLKYGIIYEKAGLVLFPWGEEIGRGRSFDKENILILIKYHLSTRLETRAKEFSI